MKGYWLIFIICLNSLKSYSQDYILSLTNQNIAYVGLDNPLEVMVKETSCNDFFLSTNNGKINGEDCKYMYRPDTTGHSSVCFYKKHIEDTVKLGCKNIRVKEIPDPIIEICGKTGGKLDKTVLKRAFSINARMDGLEIDLPIRILNYSILMLRDKKVITLKELSESRNDKDVMEILGDLKKGDVLMFFDITVKVGQKDKIKLRPLEFDII